MRCYFVRLFQLLVFGVNDFSFLGFCFLGVIAECFSRQSCAEMGSIPNSKLADTLGRYFIQQ